MKDDKKANDSPNTDRSRKCEGVTSSFSAATANNYSGEDIQGCASDEATDVDMYRQGSIENQDDEELFKQKIISYEQAKKRQA